MDYLPRLLLEGQQCNEWGARKVVVKLRQRGGQVQGDENWELVMSAPDALGQLLGGRYCKIIC